jgi:hypothetical protein
MPMDQSSNYYWPGNDQNKASVSCSDACDGWATASIEVSIGARTKTDRSRSTVMLMVFRFVWSTQSKLS